MSRLRRSRRRRSRLERRGRAHDGGRIVESGVVEIKRSEVVEMTPRLKLMNCLGCDENGEMIEGINEELQGTPLSPRFGRITDSHSFTRYFRLSNGSDPLIATGNYADLIISGHTRSKSSPTAVTLLPALGDWVRVFGSIDDATEFASKLLEYIDRDYTDFDKLALDNGMRYR